MTLNNDDVKELEDWLQIQFRVFVPAETHVLPAQPTLVLLNPSFQKSPIRIKQAAFTPGVAWSVDINMSASQIKTALLAYLHLAIDKLQKACEEESDKKKEVCLLVCTVPELVYEVKDKYNLMYITSKVAFVGKTEYAVPEVRKQNQSPADTSWNSKAI